MARIRLSEDERAKGIKLLKIAAALQYTAYGIPSVFYGDEVGLEGYGDPFCRMPFPWSDIDGTYRSEILDYYKMLGKMRKDEVFDGGDFKIFSHTENAIAYAREKNGRRILVIANRGDGFTLEFDEKYINIETEEQVSGEVYIDKDSVLLLKEV